MANIKDFPPPHKKISISTTSGNIISIEGDKYEFEKPDITVIHEGKVVAKFKLAHVEGFYFT